MCTRQDVSACDDVFDKIYPHMMYLYMMLSIKNRYVTNEVIHLVFGLYSSDILKGFGGLIIVSGLVSIHITLF